MNAQLWFYKGKGNWIDWIIRRWCKSPYSHVEIVIGATAISADAWSGKVRCADVIKFNRDNWDAVDVTMKKTPQWLNHESINARVH